MCGRPSASAGGIRATAARPRACTGGLRRGAGGDRRGGAEDPLLRHGPAAQRCRLCAGLSGGDDGGICAGHVAAFAFFGGVPLSILYDNTKLAVARILGDGARQRTRAFSELQSHYLFTDRFGLLWQGQRQGEGGGPGRVDPAQLPGAAATCHQFRSAERAVAGGLPTPPRRPAARPRRDNRCAAGPRPDRFHALPATPYDACESSRAG